MSRRPTSHCADDCEGDENERTQKRSSQSRGSENGNKPTCSPSPSRPKTSSDEESEGEESVKETPHSASREETSERCFVNDYEVCVCVYLFGDTHWLL